MELTANLQGLLKVENVTYSFREDRYFLSERESVLCKKIINTQKSVDMLREIDINYLNTTLLYGESGTGKTTFGKYVAYKMNLPFVYLNFSECIDSYLGGTSKNINRIFDYVNMTPCVLMLDEIDAIGMKRGSGKEVGELSRIVITLMQSFDILNSNVIVIAATNRKDIIDNALLRRFSSIHEVVSLNDNEISLFIKQYISTLSQEMINKINIEEIKKSNGKQSEIVKSIIEEIINN